MFKNMLKRIQNESRSVQQVARYQGLDNHPIC